MKILPARLERNFSNPMIRRVMVATFLAKTFLTIAICLTIAAATHLFDRAASTAMLFAGLGMAASAYASGYRQCARDTITQGGNTRA